jgi:hypothetical protein
MPGFLATIRPGLPDDRPTETHEAQFLRATIEALLPRHRARTTAG